MSWLGRAIEAKMQEQADAEDAEVLALLLNPPPERIVRSSVLKLGSAYEIPGDQFADGLPRLIVAERQHLADETVRAYS